MNVQITLDFRSGIPIYVQIIKQIQGEVLNGSLKPGDQLPTVRQLAADLRVNFNTVARSYRMLDEAGLISTQHGRGTYILDLPSPEAQQELRSEIIKSLTQRYLQEAARSGFSPSQVRAEFEKKFETWQQSGLPVEIN